MKQRDQRNRPGEPAAYVRARAKLCRLILAMSPAIGRRRISAMIRVKNEAEFLEPAVNSIVEDVDEVILVNNLSTDATPAIIASLRAEFPRKVRAFDYPHEIRKAGRETWELAAAVNGGESAALSSTYYNWCLRQCTQPFVLKWDGDMIALPAFREALASWKHSNNLIMIFNGINVHPDREHALAARVTEREPLLARLSVPGLPRWVTSLTRDYPEPRLFPRRFAHYNNAMLYTQRLASPFYHSALGNRYALTIPGPCFLHMKFCKENPLSNYSEDLKEVIRSNIAVGPALDHVCRKTLERWQLAPPVPLQSL